MHPEFSGGLFDADDVAGVEEAHQFGELSRRERLDALCEQLGGVESFVHARSINAFPRMLNFLAAARRYVTLHSECARKRR